VSGPLSDPKTRKGPFADPKVRAKWQHTPSAAAKPKRWEVATICINLPETEHTGVVVLNAYPDGSTIRREVVDGRDNALFSEAETRWDVADTVEAFWNRLNDSDISGPYGAHRETECVKVLWVREVQS
jgi:hypothetical protein